MSKVFYCFHCGVYVVGGFEEVVDVEVLVDNFSDVGIVFIIVVCYTVFGFTVFGFHRNLNVYSFIFGIDKVHSFAKMGNYS